jgi:hypothetical protein
MNAAPANYALVTALQEDYRARAEHHRFVAEHRAAPAPEDGNRRSGLLGWLSRPRLSLRGEGPVA